MLTFYCTFVIEMRAAPADPEYEPEPPGTPDAQLDANSDLSQSTAGPGTPASAAPPSASAAPPSATAAPAAAASSTDGLGPQTRSGGGRPAVKAAGGKAALAVVRQANRLLHDRKPQEARELIAEELAAGQPGVGDISAEHAAKQAKTAVKAIYERAALVTRSLLAVSE